MRKVQNECSRTSLVVKYKVYTHGVVSCSTCEAISRNALFKVLINVICTCYGANSSAKRSSKKRGYYSIRMILCHAFNIRWATSDKHLCTVPLWRDVPSGVWTRAQQSSLASPHIWYWNLHVTGVGEVVIWRLISKINGLDWEVA